MDKPIAVPVTLTNAGDSPLAGTVRVWGVDGWRAEGEAARAFSLAPKGSQVVPFNVVPAADSYAALYPVHARAEFGSGPAKTAAHAILILSVAREAVAKAKPSTDAAKPWQAPRRGPLRLDVATRFQTRIAVHDQPPVAQPAGWLGSDAATGCSVGLTEVDRGQRRRAINVHPPYRTGWGDALLEWRIALPPVKPLVLEFATAIRDHDPKREGASDGVEFRVQASAGDAWQDLFSRFSAAKQWEPARVDLSAWAGREITLRLVTGPGPKHNTSCDSAFWATPTIWVGQRPTPEPDAQRAARRESALSGARQRIRAGNAIGPGGWRATRACTAWRWCRARTGWRTPGWRLPTAGASWCSRASRSRWTARRWPRTAAGWCARVWKPQFAEGVGTLVHRLLKGDQTVRAQARVWAEHGALRVAFSMPEATRDLRGEPRFTVLAIGPASDKARRVYAGFGNVIENPAKFDLHANGFQLSTRHIGLDFANGVSLLQACDVFPDLLRVDPDARLYALRTHHDATLTLLPSSRGAFAAARAYRAIANFQPAAGVANILGKICLDQWGGDYQEAADGIERRRPLWADRRGLRQARLATLGLRLPAARHLSARGQRRPVSGHGRRVPPPRHPVLPARQLHRLLSGRRGLFLRPHHLQRRRHAADGVVQQGPPGAELPLAADRVPAVAGAEPAVGQDTHRTHVVFRGRVHRDAAGGFPRSSGPVLSEDGLRRTLGRGVRPHPHGAGRQRPDDQRSGPRRADRPSGRGPVGPHGLDPRPVAISPGAWRPATWSGCRGTTWPATGRSCCWPADWDTATPANSTIRPCTATPATTT